MKFGHKKRTLKPSPKPLTILFASRFTSFGTFLDTMDEKSRDYDHSTEIEAPGHLVRKSNPHHTATLSGQDTSLGFPDDSVRVGNKTKISGSLLALRKSVKSIEEHSGAGQGSVHPTKHRCQARCPPAIQKSLSIIGPRR